MTKKTKTQRHATKNDVSIHSFWYVFGAICAAVALLAFTQYVNTASTTKDIAKRMAYIAKQAEQRKSVDALRAQNMALSGCEQKTALQIVAHPDDDLLFMNPDIARDIQAGRCVVTVFLTAGDNGFGMDYVAQRESGIRAAYGQMTGSTEIVWSDAPIRFMNKTIQTSTAHEGKVKLIFLRLFDGNVNGNGYNDRHASLAMSLTSKASLGSIDEGVQMNPRKIEMLLSALYALYEPTEIRMQDTHGKGDHSDHRASGELAQRALAQYKNLTPTAKIVSTAYEGYGIRTKNPNLSAEDWQAKREFFIVYALHDHVVCPSACEEGIGSYEDYTARQYKHQTGAKQY